MSNDSASTLAPTLASIVLLSVGGAVGCASRAALRELALRRGVEPWSAILSINLLGALLMGAVASLAGQHAGKHAHQLGVIAAFGFLGGWTTYSAFALDVVSLWRHGRTGVTVTLWALTIFGAPACAWVGSLVGAVLGALTIPAALGGGS